MLRLYRASLFAVPAVLWLLTPISIPAQQAQSLAILDLEGRGISTIEAASLTDRLRTALVRIGGVTVVERGQMEQILSEQDLQLTGCTSDECAVEVGQLLGVTSMVAGSIGKVGSTFSVDIRTVDVQSGRITHSLWRDYRGEIDGLLGIMPDIAKELVDAMGAAAAREPALPAPAVLTVRSDPDGALIRLNGAEVGTTPLDSLEIEADRLHTLSLSLDGYHALDTTLLAETEQFYDIILPLLPLPSRLSILSVPPGARVVVGGEDRGTTPLSEFEVAGNQTYTASIRQDGYQPVDTSFFAGADQSHEWNIQLVRLASRLTITSIPSGALVFMDSRRLSPTPLSLSEVVPDRQHRVLLRLDGYQQADTTFFARAGELHRMDITMKPVRVAVAPPQEAKQQPPDPTGETEVQQPSVRQKTQGQKVFWWVVGVAAVGGGSYYLIDYLTGGPPDDGLRVGNPPSLPSQ